MGHRLGSAALPFAAAGAALLRRTPTVSDAALVAVGIVLHITMVFVWSGVFVWLVRAARWRDVAAAITVALGAFFLAGVIASLSGAGAATVLPLGDRVVLALAFAGALVLGMRFAFPPLRNA
jgi:ABC-type siderophore export system fused ATPase/permease subunit